MVKKMFPMYSPISEWQVLEQKTIHMYDAAETPLEIVKLQIGKMEVYEVGLSFNFTKQSYPIIRWLTVCEYNHLKAQEGMVIW